MTRITLRRFGLLALALPIGLGGCGAPVAFQVASLAADGVSYLATGKSVFDHGLSAVAEEDCAMLRIVTEGQICRDETSTLAEAGPEAAPEEAPAPEALPAVAVEVAELPPPPAAESPVLTAALPEPVPAPTVALQPVAEPPRAAATPPAPVAEDARYLVIASFGTRDGAEKLAGRHVDLKASVLAAEVKGKPAYRVVVGPVPLGEIAAAEDRLEAAGIRESWPLRAKNAPARQAPAMLASLES